MSVSIKGDFPAQNLCLDIYILLKDNIPSWRVSKAISMMIYFNLSANVGNPMWEIKRNGLLPQTSLHNVRYMARQV